MKTDSAISYYKQDLTHVWGGDCYRKKYGKGILYSKRDVPYSLTEITASHETVLEIGSSMGQCYRWLLSEGIDLGQRYTGTDISQDGINHCKEMYPKANWIQGDFQTTEFPGQFDYVHERNAIHHMPNPLDCIRKALKLARKSLLINMRARVLHPSLSDLNKAYFVEWSEGQKEVLGKYYFNLLNITDIINCILSSESIDSVHIQLSPHFKLNPNEKLTAEHNFVAPDDVYDPEESLYHCWCLVTKGQRSEANVSIQFASWRQAIKQPSEFFKFLKNRSVILSRLKS